MVARVTNARPLVDPGVKDQLDSPSPVVFDERQPDIGRLDADTVSESLQPAQVSSLLFCWLFTFRDRVVYSSKSSHQVQITAMIWEKRSSSSTVISELDLCSQ